MQEEQPQEQPPEHPAEKALTAKAQFEQAKALCFVKNKDAYAEIAKAIPDGPLSDSNYMDLAVQFNDAIKE